jgi:16S rRNA processing protein RimM
MPTTSTADWVPIALLLRPQGRRGELLSEPLSDLAGLFAAGRNVSLAPTGATAPAEGAAATVIEDHWFPTGKNAGRIVLKLSGCDTISQAEALSGQQLLVPSSALPTLDPDTFFVGDLVGCDLFDSSAPDGPTHIGRVVDVQFPTGPDGRTRLEDAAPLLGVELLTAPDPKGPDDAEPTLVPFIRAWLDTVDIPGRRIVMHLPPGLLDAT